jgi:hypothetical protein
MLHAITLVAAVSELPPFMAAARYVSKQSCCFHSLTSIQLLDSEQGMLELEGDRAKCDQWRTRWCTPQVMQIDTCFWAGWVERCTEGGVDFLDP